MYHILREHIEKIITLTDKEFAFVQRHFKINQYKKHKFLFKDNYSSYSSLNHTNIYPGVLKHLKKNRRWKKSN